MTVTAFLPAIDDLHSAIKQRQFIPVFQPLFDLKAKSTVGFEAIARWVHPVLGVIQPGIFIPTAEKSGLIDELTLQIAKRACDEIKRADDNVTLALNLSPVQFRDPKIVEKLSAVVSQVGLSTSRIEIELTESALLEDLDVARKVACSFKERGFLLSLDDFGAGFSSLTRLHALPFDALKIDAQFVRSMEIDPAGRRIVSAVIDLGQSLGLSVVAEGVETLSQLVMLEKMGCDIAQGYYIGHPSFEIVPSDLRFPVGIKRKSSPGKPRYQIIFHLEAIYESSANAFVLLDAEGRITRINDSFAHVLHVTVSRALGSNFSDHFSSKHSSQVCRILRHLSGGREMRQLEVNDRRSGKVFVVNCTRVADYDGTFIGFSLTLTDISRLRQVEAVLEADEGYARLLATTQKLHIVWAADRQGKIDYLGPTLTATALISMEDRIADWYDRMHPEDHIRVRKEWLEWLPTGRSFSTRFRVLDSTGKWREVLSSANPNFDTRGDAVSWTGVITDAAVDDGEDPKDTQFDLLKLNLLTSQQLDLLTWAAAGKSNTDIATITGLSRRGVEYHMAQILKKLEVSTKLQAAALLGSNMPRRPIDG